MKKRKINILSGTIIVFGMILLVAVSFIGLSVFIYNDHVNKGVGLAAIVVGSVLLVLALLFFVWYIYRPLFKLQNAIEQLDAVSAGTSVDLGASADTMADTINALLDELRRSIEREHAEIVLRQQARYAELQNQINPHFLYNTLENIRSQAIIDDNYIIASMSEALGKYFRYNISKDNDVVTVEQELDNIMNYIQIQQYRFMDRFVFRIFPHVDPKELSQCRIPKMTLQPIVENAIFHGIEQKVEKGHISIHIETTQDRLIIIVADDGVGMDARTLERLNSSLRSDDGIDLRENGKSGHNGIAMNNVNSRLRLLYGEDYGLNVSSTKDLGTEVEITLPKNSESDSKASVEN